MQLFGRLRAGKAVEIIGDGAFAVLSGKQRQLAAQSIQPFGVQKRLGEVLVVRDFAESVFVPFDRGAAAFAPQILLIGICGDGPHIAEQRLLAADSSGRGEQRRDDVAGKVLGLLLMRYPRKGIGENRFHVFFHKGINTVLRHTSVLLKR